MSDGSSEAVILLGGDDPGDTRLIKEPFSDGNIPDTLHTVTDGQAALEFICRRNEYEDVPSPDIVLLDLNRRKWTVKTTGIEHHPELEHVPVIVLTGVDENGRIP
ncbi:response regulator [Natronobacterium haloterrestre]|nr:hypothetical protein [Halobiforma haloterrestris]